MVYLEYSLEDQRVVQRRRSTWKRADEQVVKLDSLSGDIRRVWGRQPAYLWSTIIIVAALLILGIDAIFHGVGAGGRDISWLLWGPLLGIALGGAYIRTRTKRSAEWSHFVGIGKGTGLYVLVDPKNRKGHHRFVEAVRDAMGR